MSGYGRPYARQFSFSTSIATGTGTTPLVAAPGAGKALAVQALTICVTTAGAGTFDIEDTSGTVELFKAPASLAVGVYGTDTGPVGVRLTTNEGLTYTGPGGVGLTISGFGWIAE